MSITRSRSRAFKQVTWASGAVTFEIRSIRHFSHNKVGYENSADDQGVIHQLSIYSVTFRHRVPERNIYVITIDIIEPVPTDKSFLSCIVVATLRGQPIFVKRVTYANVPQTAVNASLKGEYGDLKKYVEKKNILNVKSLVGVCLAQFDELWE